MKLEETKKKLIDGTICVISRYGLDKATTKLIAKEIDINEAYIYRCFENKEALFSSVFSELDNELIDVILKHITVMNEDNIDFDTRAWLFYSPVWKFLLGNEDKCLAFIRYYYSPYFTKYSMGEHVGKYQKVVELFKPLFKDEANVWMIVSHILNSMLDFSIKVYNGAVPNNDDTAEHVFRLIHESIRQYFKTKELQTQ